jgi:hypothetical protein
VVIPDYQLKNPSQLSPQSTQQPVLPLPNHIHGAVLYDATDLWRPAPTKAVLIATTKMADS